ncbi:hypothetical protein V9T40_005269 [Parthenolecanium corni]|uniref:Dihydrodipicolinate synthase family protein n=1 Tax=Parthenolecanium corni TaxID=536013 RepID=A0AAN9TFL8_9HEMI
MKDKQQVRMDLRGVIIPVPTPFENNEKQTVDYDKLRQNIRKWEQIPAGLRGYCIGATNGEGPYLRHEEKLSIIKVFKSEVAKNKLVIAGTSCETTVQTSEFSKAAAEAGADAVFIMPPHYFKSRMTETNFINYFTEVADSVPVPVIIYNASSSIGINLSVRAIETLAAHPNILCIKDDGIDKMGVVVQKTKHLNFGVWASTAGILLPALQIGCVGSMNGLSAVLGFEVCQLYDLVQNKKWDEAIELQNRLLPVDSLLFGDLGPPGLKAAMDLMGYFGGESRRPFIKVDDKTKEKIAEILKVQQFTRRFK